MSEYNGAVFFKYLIGKWKLTRVIKSRGEVFLTGEGEAIVKQSGSKDSWILIFEENLTIVVNKSTKKAFQKYKYKLDGLELSKYRRGADGKLDEFFYTLKFAENSITASKQHKCGDDTYVPLYDNIKKDSFRLTYTAQGPEKDYVAITDLVRRVGG